jgi:hypothetical protein
MNQPQPRTANSCSKCGVSLPPSLPSAACPKCLLEVGMLTEPMDNDGEGSPTPQALPLKGLPQLGEDIGHYRLIRLLGQGGMGVVFEADDHETGRRIALKILSQALDSPESRKRFLREGLIAASINHPNSVYIFGTEEIAGTPVIAMELVGGGTLGEKIASSGPMPPSTAVDTILQIVGGLEAAQKAGVLHRDIKPSNCFVDPDGTVKVGDFGLSITTSVRADENLTIAGSLIGTPAFSSPEQLRGDELTVRSDIYSLGVTFYHLLTGRLPFEGDNVVHLLSSVLEKQPEFPDSFRASIPDGLAKIVLKCLRKDPMLRFASYEDLRRALLPFVASRAVPAKLFMRFKAWVMDHVLLYLAAEVFFLVILKVADRLTDFSEVVMTLSVTLPLPILYFACLEARRGASLGKAAFGLRVVGLDEEMPGLKRSFLRVAILYGIPGIPGIAAFIFMFQIGNPLGKENLPESLDPLLSQGWAWLGLASLALLPPIFTGLVFSTCRRRNGFMGLHEIWSGTRVVSLSKKALRPAFPTLAEPAAVTCDSAKVGPYHVLAELGFSGDGSILLGYDSRLLRKVWLRLVPAGTPAIGTEARQLSRSGRLRWLNGSRAGDVCWDAYEAPSGQALLDLLSKKQGWERIRFWLLDLATELKLSEEQGLPATLRMNHIWITPDGHAKLLDFPVPAVHPHPVEEDAASAWGLIRRCAYSALLGKPIRLEDTPASALETPLPLDVRSSLQAADPGMNTHESWRLLDQLAGTTATVSRTRRCLMAGLPIVCSLIVFLVSFCSITPSDTKGYEEAKALQVSLARYQSLVNQAGPEADVDRQLLETYVSGRFGDLITRPSSWESFMIEFQLSAAERGAATRMIGAHPHVEPKEFDNARAAIETRFKDITPTRLVRQEDFIPWVLILYMIFYSLVVIFVILPCFIASLVFRGGLVMHLLGVAVVGSKGRPSRIRTLLRNFIAWLPFLVSPLFLLILQHAVKPGWVGPLFFLVLALPAAASLLMRRSLEDRLSCAWLVPRDTQPDRSPNHLLSAIRNSLS